MSIEVQQQPKMSMVPEDLTDAAVTTVQNLLYTAIFDTCNEVIAAGIGDENTVLRCGNAVAQNI